MKVLLKDIYELVELQERSVWKELKRLNPTATDMDIFLGLDQYVSDLKKTMMIKAECTKTTHL